MELGMFHHWMVESSPPLKHCSPLEVIANDNTGPLQRNCVLTRQSSLQQWIPVGREMPSIMGTCVCVRTHEL